MKAPAPDLLARHPDGLAGHQHAGRCDRDDGQAAHSHLHVGSAWVQEQVGVELDRIMHGVRSASRSSVTLCVGAESGNPHSPSRTQPPRNAPSQHAPSLASRGSLPLATTQDRL